MRFLNAAFALTLLGALVLILHATSHDTLIAARSVSPNMPAMIG
ncbi:hypothetical protein [Brevundimonas sp.]|nr:hypothetical protein [Brevundimonas sp.]